MKFRGVQKLLTRKSTVNLQTGSEVVSQYRRFDEMCDKRSASSARQRLTLSAKIRFHKKA